MNNTYPLEIIETILVVVAWIMTRLITSNSINRALKRFNFSLQRRKLSVKLINFFSLLAASILLVAIWGIDQEELLVFISSALTVLGIAFFAQWSLLSNISAGLILFFNHPIKLGDRIKIMDKDFPVEGRIEDITYFFLHIKTDDGEHITVPNSIILQKTVMINPMAAVSPATETAPAETVH